MNQVVDDLQRWWNRTTQGRRKSVYLRQQPGTPLVEHLVEAHDAAKFVMQTVTASTWSTVHRHLKKLLTPLYAPLSGFLPRLEVGLSVSSCSILGRSKTISEDLARFSCKLFAGDHNSKCSISEVQELTLLAGIIKSVFVRPSVRLSVRSSVTNLWTLYFENESTDFNANWQTSSHVARPSEGQLRGPGGQRSRLQETEVRLFGSLAEISSLQLSNIGIQ